MAMNFCSNCGAKLRAGAKFCGSCGQKIFVEPQKSLAERYAETKAQVQAAPPKVELKKSEPSKTMMEMFAEAKKNAPPPTAPWMKNPPPQPTYTPPQPTYTPPEDTTPHYKEDETIQEIFLTSDGRLNRLRYFKRTLFLAAPALLLYSMSIGSAYHGSNAGFSGALGLFLLYCLICIVPGVMLSVRRLHDLNLSGWYYLATLIPVVGVLFSLYVLFAPGTVGANKYGADPLENERVGR